LRGISLEESILVRWCLPEKSSEVHGFIPFTFVKRNRAQGAVSTQFPTEVICLPWKNTFHFGMAAYGERQCGNPRQTTGMNLRTSAASWRGHCHLHVMTPRSKPLLVRASATKLSEERLWQARNQNNRVQGNRYSTQSYFFFEVKQLESLPSKP
jgi:hypothetical protein